MCELSKQLEMKPMKLLKNTVLQLAPTLIHEIFNHLWAFIDLLERHS